MKTEVLALLASAVADARIRLIQLGEVLVLAGVDRGFPEAFDVVPSRFELPLLEWPSVKRRPAKLYSATRPSKVDRLHRRIAKDRARQVHRAKTGRHVWA